MIAALKLLACIVVAVAITEAALHSLEWLVGKHMTAAISLVAMLAGVWWHANLGARK